MNPDTVGWSASIILLATLIQQIVMQAKDSSARGVSPWLFVGQSIASVGFIIYSLLVDNRVFVLTNVCILITAIVGQYITTRRQRRARKP